MSTTRRVLVSSAIGVAGTAGIGFLLAGTAGAAAGVIIFGAAGAVVGGISQCTYRLTQKFPFSARAFTTGLAGVISGTAAGFATEAIAFSRYSNHDDTVRLYGLAAIPIATTSVALGNFIVNHYMNPQPAKAEESKEVVINSSFANMLVTGGIAGFSAGAGAQFFTGFKEGPIGGLLGGVTSKAISYGLQKTGWSEAKAELFALATTMLLDVGGLHSFGGNRAVISYDQNLSADHLCFYILLTLLMALDEKQPAAKNNARFFKAHTEEEPSNPAPFAVAPTTMPAASAPPAYDEERTAVKFKRA